MVAGLEVAIVLRSKRGPAILTQTRGVDVKSAIEASWEVADLLASHASATKDDDGSGDNPPGYTSGDMPASNNRFRVVYRLVSHVYVMAIAPTTLNIFFSTQLVNAIVHQLCVINHGINVTSEKLTSRFPEVYLAVNALMANGGQIKSASDVAEAAVDSISSEATKAVKQIRKSVAHPLDMLRGRSVTSKAPAPDEAPLYVAPRSLADEVDPLTVTTFKLPADALPPLTYVEPEKPGARPAAGWDMSGYRLYTLSPAASEAEAAAAAGELGPSEPIGGDMWTNFPEGPRPDAPPIEDMDFPETPTGPRGLWMEEIWRCHVIGKTVKQAGTLGQVLGTVPLTKEHLKTSFRLRLPQQMPSTALEKAIGAAQYDPTITVRTEDWYNDGLHVAAFDQTFGKNKPVFMQYRLPAIVLPPPIQVRFAAMLSEPAEGSTRRRLTLLLRYIVNPAALIPLYAVTVDVDLHPHLEAPLKVSPAATWAKKQHRVQWQLPSLAPGATGDLKAYFEPEAAGDALAVAGKRGGLTASAVEEAVCRIRFTGPPRATLSGTSLMAGTDANSLEPVAEQAFFGELTAQAEVVCL